MKKSKMEKEMRDHLQCPGALLVLPANMTFADAMVMGPSALLDILVEDRKPKEGWEPEEPSLPDRLAIVEVGKEGPLHPPRGFLVPAGRGFASSEEQLLAYMAAMDAYNRVQIAGGPDKSVVVNKDLYSELCEQAASGSTAEISPRSADVISKTRQGTTVHYAIGPARKTREEAGHDLRLFQERA